MFIIDSVAGSVSRAVTLSQRANFIRGHHFISANNASSTAHRVHVYECTIICSGT